MPSINISAESLLKSTEKVRGIDAQKTLDAVVGLIQTEANKGMKCVELNVYDLMRICQTLEYLKSINFGPGFKKSKIIFGDFFYLDYHPDFDKAEPETTSADLCVYSFEKYVLNPLKEKGFKVEYKNFNSKPGIAFRKGGRPWNQYRNGTIYISW